MIPNIRYFLPKIEKTVLSGNCSRLLISLALKTIVSKSPLVGLCPFIVLVGDQQLQSYTWAHRCARALRERLAKEDGHARCGQQRLLSSSQAGWWAGSAGAHRHQPGPWLGRGIAPSPRLSGRTWSSCQEHAEAIFRKLSMPPWLIKGKRQKNWNLPAVG